MATRAAAVTRSVERRAGEIETGETRMLGRGQSGIAFSTSPAVGTGGMVALTAGTGQA
jgi:hypothetical protein